MTEREEIEKAMAALDGQRTVLGDAAVEAALAGLQQKLAALEKAEPVSPSLAGERRVVTVLFCDVKGSTAMAGKLDPEEWAGIMKRAFAYLVAPVTRHEGTVAQLLGDAILAYFGAPLAHEDDPQRAVRAGLEIVEGITVFREQLQRERGLKFNVRVGINTGLVMVGQIGADQRVEYLAVGDTVNLAARMEQSAQPGSVQIAEPTFKFVEPWFECEALGGIPVKGKSEPVHAYRVLGVKANLGRGRGLERQGLASPLVGRDQELKAIRSRVENLSAAGEGGIAGIIGEAGLGKSRLVAEAKSSALLPASKVIWLEGQTLSFGQTISYWPFQQILRGWATITEEDDADTMWSKLETHVRGLFGEETIDYLPYLASLLALEVRGEYTGRVKYLDGEAMGKQIFLTARRFFDRLARTRPTVLVFEDLHWMDESSTHLLEHVLPLVESVPLLIFGLSRPERDTPAARLRDLCARDYADRYTEILLLPLSAADSALLVHNLLQIEDLPVRLRALIVAKAEGNPFFLEEVIRTLIETRAVTRDASSGRWRAAAQIEAVHLPDTLQGVIMARVDRLDEEVKQVLRTASVIGRSFLYRVLDAIAEAGQRLDDDLSELQQCELIREKQHLPELEYMFKHALAQEATYESILLQKRRDLHARVGQAVESLFAERLEEFYGLLAYHFAKAEAWEKAQAYLLKAADQAGQLAGDAEALNLYEQALKAYGRAFGDKWDPVQRAAVERKVGEALLRRGEHAQALEHFYRGLEYLGKPFPKSRGKVRQAIIMELIEQAGNRLLPRLFLKEVAERVSAAVEEEFNLYVGIGEILAFTNIEGLLLVIVRALNFVEQNGYLYGIARGLAGFGVILDFIPAFGIAEHYVGRATALAEQLRHPGAVGNAYYGLALHELLTGKLDLALAHLPRAIEASQEEGDLQSRGRVFLLMAATLIYRGELERGLQEGTSLVRLGQDAMASQLECWGEMLQGLARKRIGQLSEARVHLERSIKLAAMFPDHYSGLLASGELAQCCLRMGEIAEASAALKSGEQLRAQYKAAGDSYTHLVHGLAEACLLQAERASPSEREAWLRKANRACQSALKQVMAFYPGAPEAMLLRGRYEWLRGQPKAARQWWTRSLVESKRMGMRYDEGMTHLEMGQRLGEGAHLEKAEAIFVEVGAALDLARTRKLLLRRVE
jgi:class 3 adenylate cyclase/tetratricopeptide (TPR) repeat protein